MTYATTKACQRARAKAAGFDTSNFSKGEFVAIDGEGFNEGETIEIMVGDPPHVYKGQNHNYALLMASDGSEAYNPTGRLTTKQCLDFLCDIAENNPRAIIVCYGASYDMTHMLMEGLNRDQISSLLRADNVFVRRIIDIRLGDNLYRLEYRPRKSLTVWRWPAGVDQYEMKTKKNGEEYWKLSGARRAVLWDVLGFFQSTFVDSLKAWLPSDPDLPMIAAMKAKRSTFERSEIADVRHYTRAELRLTVSLMESLRASVSALGLKIQRWDGAGSIAGAFFRKHKVREHMAPSPPEIFEAARIAYSGGHIEACKLGYREGPTWHYDINSAYPHQFRRLPSLRAGAWRTGKGAPPSGFTLVHVRYQFRRGLPFYPLFHRAANGTIRYPRQGEGWFWFVEFQAGERFADAFGAITFDVLGWHHFETSANESPFSWIEEAYNRRQAIVAESKRTSIPNGEEKAIKLGINSCYGKTAQQVGARIQGGELRPPSYFQLEWAGFVTAGCRAQLMEAAMQKPDAVISFATDALFTTEPLDLYTPKEKELGAWEAQEHLGMTMVMPGVYWTHDEPSAKKPSGTTHYSRGFDKVAMEDAGVIHRAWRKGQATVGLGHKRMVTLGIASLSDNFWRMRGLFVETTRDLKLNGSNSKRYAVSLGQCAPHKGMVDTWPQENDEDGMSAPYEIEFMKNAADAGDIDGVFLDDSEAEEAGFFL